MFTFIHAADIHLDSPLRGLDAYEDAPREEIRQATRRALENLVHLCIDQNARFLLIAGDLYDGDWEDYNTGLFFTEQMVRLRDVGIPVYIIRGNHDAASAVTRELRLPENVHVFRAEAAETVELSALDVVLHGQSFATAAVVDDLAADYPAPVPGRLNIGLLHTALAGREGHDRYAPCTVQELVDRGYDYWALGHVHGVEIVHEEPHIVFPGNLQGRHIRETGDKGAMVVRVDGTRIVDITLHETAVMSWELVTVDITDAETLEAVLDRVRAKLEHVADKDLLAVRVELEGACAIHGRLLTRHAELRDRIRNLGKQVRRGRVWIEKVRQHTRPKRDLEEVLAGDDSQALLVRIVRDLEETAEIARLQEEFAALAGKLPPDVDVDLAAESVYREALEDARDILLDRLLTSGEDA